MSCTCETLKAIGTTCGESSIGGIKKVIVACKSDIIISDPTVAAEGYKTVTVANDAHTYELKFRKGSSSFGYEYTMNDANGVKYVTSTAELVFSKMTVARRNAVQGLLDSELVAFIYDNNGVVWVMGVENEVTATASTGTTGVAAGDANQMTATLTDITSSIPFALDAAGIAAIEDDDVLVTA